MRGGISMIAIITNFTTTFLIYVIQIFIFLIMVFGCSYVYAKYRKNKYQLEDTIKKLNEGNTQQNNISEKLRETNKDIRKRLNDTKINIGKIQNDYEHSQLKAFETYKYHKFLFDRCQIGILRIGIDGVCDSYNFALHQIFRVVPYKFFIPIDDFIIYVLSFYIFKKFDLEENPLTKSCMTKYVKWSEINQFLKIDVIPETNIYGEIKFYNFFFIEMSEAFNSPNGFIFDSIDDIFDNNEINKIGVIKDKMNETKANHVTQILENVIIAATSEKTKIYR